MEHAISMEKVRLQSPQIRQQFKEYATPAGFSSKPPTDTASSKSVEFGLPAADYKICADGAANYLYQQADRWLEPSTPLASEDARKQLRPDLIKGDMDSIKPSVLEFYKAAGCRIEDDSEDQDSTDLQKCVWGAESWREQGGLDSSQTSVVALGAFGGRLDHTLSNLNCLYTNPDVDIVLGGDGSLARLLPQGNSEVVAADQEGPHCGIVALGAPAYVSSTGLQYDMEDTEVSIGGLLSTSNRLANRTVSIITSTPVLWMTEIAD